MVLGGTFLSWNCVQLHLFLSYQVSATRQELRKKQLQDVVVENYENLPGLCLGQQLVRPGCV